MRLLSQSDTSERSIENMQNAQQFAIWLLEIGEGKRNQSTKVSLPPSIMLYINRSKTRPMPFLQ